MWTTDLYVWTFPLYISNDQGLKEKGKQLKKFKKLQKIIYKGKKLWREGGDFTEVSKWRNSVPQM